MKIPSKKKKKREKRRKTENKANKLDKQKQLRKYERQTAELKCFFDGNISGYIQMHMLKFGKINSCVRGNCEL